MTSGERDNETWVRHLSGTGDERSRAVADLRDLLFRGLQGNLITHPNADRAFLEDSVQDSLIRILERLPQFEGRSRFVTWATSIAIRVALSELRRRRWKDASLDDLTERTSFAPATDRDEERLTARQDRQAIVDKMLELIHAELTDRQREALVAELNGMPQEEIARCLGSNRNAVYKLTHDARKRLKRALETAGYRAEDVRAAFAT